MAFSRYRNVLHRHSRALGATLLIAFIVSACSVQRHSGAASHSNWKVGLARTVITPNEVTWLSGYGSRTKPAEGIEQDLFAKAVAFEDFKGTRLVLVTMDLGSVNVNTTDYVAAQVEKRFGLPRANLVLNCSHTHCAPEIGAERRVFCNLSDIEAAKLDRYIDQTNEKLVALIGAALADLKPAHLSVGHSQAGFAWNRRHPSGINTNGVTDREVPVLRVTDVKGKLRGVLFGYACHNTTLNFQRFCADYAGYAQAEIEADHPGAIAMFVMGCGGDQNPQPRHAKDPKENAKQLQYAKQHGRELADAVNRAMTGELQPLRGPLSVAYEVATLDLEPLPPVDDLRTQAKGAATKVETRKARYLVGLLDAGKQIPLTQSCPLHVARFGDDLLWIFISGETVVDYSLRFKREFAGPFVWVAGYCDDVFAYLPSQRVRLEGGYEGSDGIVHQLTATPFQPTVEQRVMEAITRLVSETKTASH